MTPWTLVDCLEPLEEDEENPRRTIHSEEELRQELQTLRRREPGIVFLREKDRDGLELAIGGPYAALRWLPPDSAAQRVGECVAVAGHPRSPGPVEFSAEGIPTPVTPEELFSVEEVIDAALYFYREGRRPEWITWRQWNLKTKQWDTIPATRPAPVGVLAK